MYIQLYLTQSLSLFISLSLARAHSFCLSLSLSLSFSLPLPLPLSNTPPVRHTLVQYVAVFPVFCVAMCCSILQYLAFYCSMLQSCSAS